ncbi:MAG TPA: glycosyl hydrolase [Bryobacteraceae bacterium]|nr:glycosyl hydrolase [Bryobacteraceae bacterium]
MRTMRMVWCAGGVLIAVMAAALAAAPGRDALEAGFTDPPQEARLRCYWWWLNGHTDKATISRDLEQMKAKGYGGALLVDAGGAEQQGNQPIPAGPTFASAEWRDLFRHALSEAARLGLEITFQVQSGWNLGGPTVKPEQASKLLTWSRTTVEGPREFHERLPQPRTALGFYRDIATLAYPLHHGADLPARPIRQLAVKSAAVEAGFSMPDGERFLEDIEPQPGEEDARVSDVRDLTASLSPEGELTWSVPAGAWEMLRIGFTCSGARVSTSSGAWQGLAIDYMDRSALETYWREVLDPLFADAKPYLGTTLRYLATDSWELGGTNWTPRFRDEFRRRRGYDALPYLPVIAGRILDGREASNRFLADFRRTIGDLILNQHYVPFAELARRYGLGIHPESGGPHGAPIDALATLGASAIPQTEFWARSATHRTRDEDRFFVKEAASAAHIEGKTLVAAEGMTSIGPQWEESLWDDLKPTFDQAVCEGLNRLIWHTFTSSPREMGVPGQEYFAGSHLNPNVTWWGEAGALVSYINRSQFLLQQGLPVADVVYYYGDQVPNFAPLKRSDPARVLPGYDYDSADEGVLTHRMSVRDGRIVLPDGMSYRLLVLPSRDSISLAALRTIQKLVNAGAAVFGPKPRRATGLGDDDTAVRAIADELWGTGKVHSVQTGRGALASLGISPDFAGGPNVDYIHRRTSGADIYFVRNTRPEWVDTEAAFRVFGKQPELWHPDSGRIEPEPVYNAAGATTRVPLRLEPNGSVFVLFRRPSGRHAIAPLFADAEIDLAREQLTSGTPGDYEVALSDGAVLHAQVDSLPEPVTVVGPWTVEFTPGRQAPDKVVFPRLESWTANADPGIRYYSGTAKYRARFEAPAADHMELDLGDVRELARVRVNGRDLGVLWKPPFRVSLDGATRPGGNDLEVEVTNLWPNRLVGDQLLPAAERLTHTNIVKWRADSPLLVSGLLGPVTVRSRATVKLQ